MKIFLFFLWKAIKIAGSAQKAGSVGLAETQVFFRPKLTNKNFLIWCNVKFPLLFCLMQ